MVSEGSCDTEDWAAENSAHFSEPQKTSDFKTEWFPNNLYDRDKSRYLTLTHSFYRGVHFWTPPALSSGTGLSCHWLIKDSSKNTRRVTSEDHKHAANLSLSRQPDTHTQTSQGEQLSCEGNKKGDEGDVRVLVFLCHDNSCKHTRSIRVMSVCAQLSW